MKKFLFTFGLLVLVLGALAGSVRASVDSPLERPAWQNALDSMQESDKTLVDMVAEVAEASYVLSQKSAGRSSFKGYCGLMASHQLYNLGINKNLVVKNGNNQFDYYLPLEVSSGDYYINPYPSEEYTLENALNAVSDFGNKDVFNVLVCFQWTSTEAGSQYGHVMLINAIVDGYVYFVESYDTPFGPEGSLLICDIDAFVDFYDPWTLFEGLIHFGDGEYSQVCPTISTDLVVQTRFQSRLRSQPAMLGKKGSVHLRDVPAGEKLRAVAVCKDTRGEYYKVLTDEGEAYISVAAVSVVGSGDGDMELTGLKLPEAAKAGKAFKVAGTVVATHGRVASLEVCLTAQNGDPVRKASVEIDDRFGLLEVLNDSLYADLLDPGTYTAEVVAYCVSPVAGDVWGQSRYKRVVLAMQTLVVE